MAGWTKRDLVDIACEIIPDLEEKQGENGIYYVGCCPLHDDHNPSFTIYPNDGPQTARWQCWSGCGGGDVLDLVQRYFNLSFKEALKIASDKADEADIAEEMARKSYTTTNYDFRLLSMRMKRLLDRIDFGAATRVFESIDMAVEQGDYQEIERILREHDL